MLISKERCEKTVKECPVCGSETCEVINSKEVHFEYCSECGYNDYSEEQSEDYKKK